MSKIPAKLRAYFEDYASFHTTRGNQITHYFGITFIVVSLLGLLGGLPIFSDFPGSSEFFRLDAGTLLLLAGGCFYLYMDWKIAGPFLLVLCGGYFLGRALPLKVNWGLFIGGWILQGIGHSVFEKKSPAFFRNFTHLLIGPLWIFAKTIGYR